MKVLNNYVRGKIENLRFKRQPEKCLRERFSGNFWKIEMRFPVSSKNKQTNKQANNDKTERNQVTIWEIFILEQRLCLESWVKTQQMW